MNLTFRQRDDRLDKAGRGVIFLDVTWNGQRLPLPTGVKCRPEHWKPERNQRRIHTKDLDSAQHNNKLAALEAAVRKLFAVADANEELVTVEQLRACLPATKARVKRAEVKTPETILGLYALWQQENPALKKESARRYKQVIAHLEAWHPGLRLDHLTRRAFLDYQEHTTTLGLSDATVSKHVKFLRECHRLAGQPVPAWLKLKARYGRAPALQQEEFHQLVYGALDREELQQERDLTVFQCLLLLRDSDLRSLRPHHVTTQQLPGLGKVPILTFHQQKTQDEVRLPLPPLAVKLWQQWQGQPPVPVQQVRNRRQKELGRCLKLTRPFVRVRYIAGQATEEVLPLYKVITTHTARHTGADMVVLGSGGNQDLKECALGHSAIYGKDSLERYGPLLLKAWEKVLAKDDSANSLPLPLAPDTPTPLPPKAPANPSTGGIRSYRFS